MLTKTNRTGETNIASNGMKMTIIAYRNSHDIDVQFEDGTVIKHKAYQHFQLGNIKNPNAKLSISKRKIHESRIGETNIASNGMKMTIIAYRNSHDIDVQFEDKTIVEHKTYSSFKYGKISHPNFVGKNHINQTNRIGETTTAKNGMRMTIIEYRNASDMDVQFEDGAIARHKTYRHFYNGHIQNPTDNKINKIGKTTIANNGMKMTIIAYRTATDIDIRFEDGVIRQHKRYEEFKTGSVKHPYPYAINDMIIIKRAYVYNSVGNFYCKCDKCGIKDIMDINEIKQHKC